MISYIKRKIRNYLNFILNDFFVIQNLQLEHKIKSIISNQPSDKKYIGQLLIWLQEEKIKNSKIIDLSTVEFSIYSQFGQDGILNYLINTLNIPIEYQTFIEFGVENYEEATTRFLLELKNWRGLVIDGDEKNIEWIKSQNYYWKNDLEATSNFITLENINTIITKNFTHKNLGLLVIDIDGNDYWILKTLNNLNPIIIVCEFNSTFGEDRAVTIPYNPNFNRSLEHYSNLYFGASIKAIIDLLRYRNYTFIGTNINGNDAFFIRNDYYENKSFFDLKPKIFNSSFRESRDINGDLSFLKGKEKLRLIKNLEIFDLDSNQTITIKDLFNLN